jgi:hypothetical protein
MITYNFWDNTAIDNAENGGIMCPSSEWRLGSAFWKGF